MRDVVKALGQVIVLRESYREWLALRTFASRKWKNKAKTPVSLAQYPSSKMLTIKSIFLLDSLLKHSLSETSGSKFETLGIL